MIRSRTSLMKVELELKWPNSNLNADIRYAQQILAWTVLIDIGKYTS